MEDDGSRVEIERIMSGVSKIHDYQGYVYDRELGFVKGPYEGVEYDDKIRDNQAVIWVKQPISRQAQRHMLLVERGGNGEWELKKTLLRREG
jgi:hypothetical protein